MFIFPKSLCLLSLIFTKTLSFSQNLSVNFRKIPVNYRYFYYIYKSLIACRWFSQKRRLLPLSFVRVLYATVSKHCQDLCKYPVNSCKVTVNSHHFLFVKLPLITFGLREFTSTVVNSVKSAFCYRKMSESLCNVTHAILC